jgi:hypothetical protein
MLMHNTTPVKNIILIFIALPFIASGHQQHLSIIHQPTMLSQRMKPRLASSIVEDCVDIIITTTNI